MTLNLRGTHESGVHILIRILLWLIADVANSWCMAVGSKIGEEV